MTKTKKVLIILLFALLFVAVSVIFFGWITASAAVYTAEEIFSFRNITGYQTQALDDSNRPVFAVTTKSGGEILVNGDLSGDFSLEAGSSNITSYMLVFTDSLNGNTLAIDAKVAGSKVVLSLGGTLEGENIEISSVTVSGGTKVKYIFEPAALAMKVEDIHGTAYTLSEPTGLPISGFESYSVAVKIISASEEGRFDIYSLCGYDCIVKSMYSSSEFKPSVYVKAESYAVYGEPFSVPVAKASVLGGERIEKINAVVYENGTKKASGSVPSELKQVTFDAKGSAEIVYTATAKSGIETIYTLKLSILEAGEVYNTFVPDGNTEDITIGTNTEVFLPYVVNSSTLNVSEAAYYPSLVYIIGPDGTFEDFSGAESAKAQKARFNKAGEYTVTFKDRSEKGNALSYQIMVEDELVGLDGVMIEEFYEYGSDFIMQPAKLYYKGESAEAEVTAVAPNGTQFHSNFIFSMGGIWKLIYSAELSGGEQKTELELTVYERADGSFSCKTSSVGYETLADGNSGVLLTSPADEEIVFERTVDLSSAKVNTETYTTEPNEGETFLHIKDRNPNGSFCLIDFNVVNTDAATLDYSRIYIRVTDVYDEENYFEIRIADGAFAGAGGMSYIRARAVGQSFSGLDVRNGKYGQQGAEELKPTQDGFNESGGFLMSYGFQKSGSEHKREDSFKIYYDNQNKALFAISGTQYCSLICDFDDPRFSSILWDGFTTGEAVVSIRMGNISNSAKLIVYSVGTYDFTSEYLQDKEAPVLELDSSAATSAYALIGRPFPVFEARSFDKNYSKVVVKVYQGSEEISVENGYFVPQKPSVYTLAYYAVDAFGNCSETIYVSVRAQSPGKGISLTVENKETAALLGRIYYAPDYEVKGASGVVDSFFGWRKKGEGNFIQSTDGMIRFPETGTYEVIYKVIDYLGQSAEDSFEVIVTETDVPVVESNFSFYKMMFTGEAFGYEIPVLPAYIYTAVGIEQAEESIRIYDGDALIETLQPGDIFSPDHKYAGKTLTAKYFVEGSEEDFEYSFIVRIKEEGNKQGYFLQDENVSYSESESSQPIFTMSENGGFSFVKELLADNFSITFYFPEGADAFGTVKLILTDSYNTAESIAISFKKRGGDIVASTDGVNWYDCAGDWNSSAGLFIGYRSAGKKFVDSMDSSLGVPDFTTDGRTAFKGFSSGKVYFRLETIGVTSPVSLCVTEINNQQMSVTTDRTAPELFVFGSYPGYDIGDTVTVLPAVAGDVLHQYKNLTVSVFTGSEKFPVYIKDINGTEIRDLPADKEYYFTASAYDSYTVLYTCYDTSERENKKTLSITIAVSDKEPPVASLIQSTLSAKVGESINLKNFLVVSDNVTPEEELIIDISVRQNRLREYAEEDGSYTFLSAGKYYIDYLVRDASGNLTLLTLAAEIR